MSNASTAGSPLRPRLLQVLGERCSGTNYVAQLLRRNAFWLRLTDQHGWKHGFCEEVGGPASDTLFVLVVRDPFDWATSLWRTPWHAAQPLRDAAFSEFVRMEWECEWGRDMELAANDPRVGTEMVHERDPLTGRRFLDVLALRAAKLRSCLALASRVQRFSVVRYEDAAARPRELCAKLLGAHCVRRWPWFRAVRTWKGGAEPFVPKPRHAMSRADVLHVASRLDASLERELGYDVDARKDQLLAAADGSI